MVIICIHIRDGTEAQYVIKSVYTKCEKGKYSKKVKVRNFVVSVLEALFSLPAVLKCSPLFR